MEQDPTQAPAEVARKVFPEKARTSTKSSKVRLHDDYTQEDLDRAAQCGKFPNRPSDLFLRVCRRCNMIYAQRMSDCAFTRAPDVLRRFGYPRARSSQGYVFAVIDWVFRSRPNFSDFVVCPTQRHHLARLTRRTT